MTDTPLPSLAITLGDPSGIGPEVVARALCNPEVQQCCQPTVIGDPQMLSRAIELIMRTGPKSATADRIDVRQLDLDCFCPTDAQIDTLRPGVHDASSGKAAEACIFEAIERAKEKSVDAIVTAPINKKSLQLAGFDLPGHTEILARQCGVDDVAMMLHLPAGDIVSGPHGLSVAHATLHTSIASVPGLLSTERILETIRLVDEFIRRIGGAEPRIGVAALNPHAGEEGLFGDEEARIIHPAVEAARGEDIDASGPHPTDTLMKRAVAGEFDGVVAMYHDQGHIALKLIGFDSAVNVTLGLPIIRTSPSHGTAFDIAWQGVARADGMIAAIRLAAKLAQSPDSSPAH